MERRLNVAQVSDAMGKAGLNQAALAQRLDVSREAVSKWLQSKIFPRPDKLLRLGKLLALPFDQLVIREEPHAPVVAFRRMKGTKTRDHHVENAKTMGRMLRHLVPYLPFDTLTVPPTLNEPRSDYAYLQQVAAKVRTDINVPADQAIDFTHLIRRFCDLHTVLIPVLWGDRNRHENATHIYLPDSRTTWVYLNLDVNIHDFKFWMAHELGHCLAPELRDNAGEDFADAFAGALLFPESLAKPAREQILQYHDRGTQLTLLEAYARQYVIAPFTVYKQVNAYAAHHALPVLALEPDIHKLATRFNQSYKNLSESLFEGNPRPEPADFIREMDSAFETPFFKLLSQYLRENHKGPGMVQTLMNIPLLDARSLHAELV